MNLIDNNNKAKYKANDTISEKKKKESSQLLSKFMLVEDKKTDLTEEEENKKEKLEQVSLFLRKIMLAKDKKIDLTENEEKESIQFFNKFKLGNNKTEAAEDNCEQNMYKFYVDYQKIQMPRNQRYVHSNPETLNFTSIDPDSYLKAKTGLKAKLNNLVEIDK